MLKFSPVNERVASVRLQVAGRKVLSVVVAYTPNSGADYPAFLDSGWCAGRGAIWGPQSLTGSAGNEGETRRDVIGMNGLPDLNPNRALSLDFCASQRPDIKKKPTVFEHKVLTELSTDRRLVVSWGSCRTDHKNPNK